MMNQKILILLLVFIILISFPGHCFSAITDGKNVQKVYSDATVGCTICHTQGNFKSLNKYGSDYKAAGRSAEAVKAIDTADSDSDGVINADEINAGTNPGDTSSK